MDSLRDPMDFLSSRTVPFLFKDELSSGDEDHLSEQPFTLKQTEYVVLAPDGYVLDFAQEEHTFLLVQQKDVLLV